MSSELEKDILQLRNKMEDCRQQLNSLTVKARNCYKNNKILELSAALDQIIVEYMRVVYSTRKISS